MTAESRPVVLAVEQLRRRVPGGIGRYAAGLLSGLREVDAPRVVLLASRPPGAGRDPLARWGYEVRASRLPSPLLTLAWDRGLLAAPRGARAVQAVSLAFPRVRPTRRAGGPALVVTVHDLAWRTNPETTTGRGRRWHEAALRRALGRADAFVVPSRPVAEALVAAGVTATNVRVIPHGADHLPAPDHDGATAVLRHLGVGEGYLLAAGTLEPRKNLPRLVEAYAAARPQLGGGLPLVVVGPSGWGDALGSARSGAGGVGAGEGVLLAGAVDDGVLAALYAGARAFAYVPLVEGFGLPPVEAMACGTPVVTSTAVPSTEPAPGAEAPALRVDAASVDDIAAALVRVTGDDRTRAALVARGVELAASLTWARSAAAHIAWWEEHS